MKEESPKLIKNCDVKSDFFLNLTLLGKKRLVNNRVKVIDFYTNWPK